MIKNKLHQELKRIMNKSEWKWKTSDGLEMYSRSWIPEKKTKALVFLVHGFQEHIGRYDHVGRAFSKAGFSLLGFDMRGHGKSQGLRGHTRSYEILLNDLDAFIDQMTKKYPDLPYFLYGHSMGGGVVMNFVMRRKTGVKGVIATAPWIKLAFQPPESKVRLAKIMNKIHPAFSQNTDLEIEGLSRDPKVVRAYARDPLVHGRISARMFLALYENGLWILDNAKKLTLPLLLMHGGEDRIVSLEACKEFINRNGKKATFHIWDGYFHEIHNEPGQEKVFKAMFDWMGKTIKS